MASADGARGSSRGGGRRKATGRGGRKSAGGGGRGKRNSTIKSTMKGISEETKEEFTFFFSGTVFSQWYPCQFTVGGIQYSCAEQFMMHRKAGELVSLYDEIVSYQV